VKNIFKMILYGSFIWLTGYIAGFIAFPLIEIYYILFKTIMVIVGAIAGAIFTALYFRKIDNDYLPEGIAVGVVWLLVNWLFDFLLLLPLSKQPVSQYMLEIGLRYLAIPAMTVTVGYLLELKTKE